MLGILPNALEFVPKLEKLKVSKFFFCSLLYKLLKEEVPVKGKCKYTFFLSETKTILKFSEAI